MTKKPRKSRLWEFDPTVFQPLRKAGFVERYFATSTRFVAKYVLYGLAFAYPIILISLGLIFGGLVFWLSFSGSFLIIWGVLKKTGYARNFASWDLSYRKFLGLGGAFGMMLALVYGLAYSPLKIFTIPVIGVALVIVLVVGVAKMSRR